MSDTPTKRDVISLMRRLGMQDRIPQAELELPDVVDVDRDFAILARLGLDKESAMDRLGSSP